MLTIQFKTDNAAFAEDGSAEVARILRKIASKIENTRDGSGPAVDLNGNTVGHWSLSLGELD